MSIGSPTRRNLERVPPRRRRPKRSVWRRTVFPLAKLAALIVVVGVVVWMSLAKVARPFALLSIESGETRILREELNSLKKENAALERRNKYLQTPQGAVQAARKMGYVKPGEVSLMLPADAAPSRTNSAE